MNRGTSKKKIIDLIKKIRKRNKRINARWRCDKKIWYLFLCVNPKRKIPFYSSFYPKHETRGVWTTKWYLFRFFGQNIILWYNLRFLKIPYFFMFKHQLISILVIGGAAGLSVFISNYIIESLILSLLASIIFYSLFLFVIIFTMPWLFSTNRMEIKNILGTVIRFILKFRNPIVLLKFWRTNGFFYTKNWREELKKWNKLRDCRWERMDLRTRLSAG